VLPYNDRHWRSFFTVIGKPELTDDPRFENQPARSKNIDALYNIVLDAMTAKTSAEWLTLLEEADIPVMPMNTPEDLFDCPHLKAVGMFPTAEHPTEGTIRHIKVPVHFSKTPGGLYRHAENLGESTEAVLADAGYSTEEIEALQKAGAAGKTKRGG
jgi:crotonobetainyl-CoA:carnitine CoA-transferase CaiB-like acyl-CoA transferase